MSRVSFWFRLATHRLSQRAYEISYFRYCTEKLFNGRWAQNEADLFAKGSDEVSLDGFQMTKTGKLRINDRELNDLLADE